MQTCARYTYSRGYKGVFRKFFVGYMEGVSRNAKKPVFTLT